MMDEGQERVQATYRGNYHQLAGIKAHYDPANLFHINQNIRPSNDPAGSPRPLLQPVLHEFGGAAVQFVGLSLDVGEHIDDAGQVLDGWFVRPYGEVKLDMTSRLSIRTAAPASSP